MGSRTGRPEPRQGRGNGAARGAAMRAAPGDITREAGRFGRGKDPRYYAGPETGSSSLPAPAAISARRHGGHRAPRLSVSAHYLPSYVTYVLWGASPSRAAFRPSRCLRM
ncbi:hypothetical protein GCM10010393_02460 [Streptomyces gobitricini]|uniref:Uncharacterized protein n=1 Tax=Streptomyces gobitricini TaxID=68211 RepID=A0ABN3L4S7_9ACTN